MLRTTLAFAIPATILTICLSAPLAWLTERTDAPFRSLAYIGAFAALAIPAVIKAIAWVLMLGPRNGVINALLREVFGPDAPVLSIFSLGGLIFFEAIAHVPLAFLLLAPAFRTMDPALEEAAQMAGATPLQTFWRVTARVLSPSLLSVLFLTLILNLESFEGPAILGVPGGLSVLSVEIYSQVNGNFRPRYGLGSAYAVLLVILVLLALYPYQRATRDAKRFATVAGRGFRPQTTRLGRWRLPAGILTLLVPVTIAVPFLVLVWASLLPSYVPPSMAALKTLTLANYVHAFQVDTVSTAALNSLFMGIAAATVTIALTLVVAWVIVRSNLRGRMVVDQMATLPLVLPGIVLSMALLLIYLRVPLPIYGTRMLLVIAYVTCYLPFGMRYAHAALVTINRELEESAQTSGAGFWSTLTRITLPLLAPALFSGWIYVFLGSIRQLALVSLLAGPATYVISTSMFHIWELGNLTDLAAFAVMVVVVVVAIALGFQALAARVGLRIEAATTDGF